MICPLKSKDYAFFSEWVDSFYARDTLELFGIRNRQGFLSLFRLLLRQSGGQLDYSQLANLSELSRPTVKTHIEAMQIAHAVHLLRPFHGGGKREIVSRPKCYAFDTGFVTFEKGWDLSAFLIWGFSPLYYRAVGEATALEIVAHRVVWSLLLCLALVSISGQSAQMRQLFINPRQLGTLLISALLVSVNWLGFIWAGLTRYSAVPISTVFS